MTLRQRLPMPTPRGPLSRGLSESLTGDRTGLKGLVGLADAVPAEGILLDDDAQLSLLLLYELHYRGIEDVTDGWEWHPQLLEVRAVLEDRLESELRSRTTIPQTGPDGIPEVLFAMTAPTPDRGSSLAGYLARHGTIANYRDFLTLRSVYHLKEADPHTWAIPRLAGSAKAALVEIQADEYGGGRAERMHATLFADSMQALDLDYGYGRLVDQVPAVVLAGVNAMSMFGLNRRLLGAIVGHLAAFEMTSSLPNRLYGNGLRRLGYDATATRFFDEHVQADAVHEQIAGRDLAGSLAVDEPDRIPDILFGASACLLLDDLAAQHMLAHFRSGTSPCHEASASSPIVAAAS